MRCISAAILTALAGGTPTLGCGDSGGTPPSADMAKVSGDEQAAGVGQVIADPLAVQVTSGGVPSAGAAVTWSTTTAGGLLDPGSSVTDADGRASTVWILGTLSGRQSATATLSGGPLVTFMATAVAAAATTVTRPTETSRWRRSAARLHYRWRRG